MSRSTNCLRRCHTLIVTLLFLIAAVGLTGCVTKPPKPREEPKNLVWPPAPEQPRIRYIKSYRGQMDFKQADDMRNALFGIERGGLSLAKPYGVAVSHDGTRMYVTDAKLRGLVVFDLEKEKVFMLQTDAMGGLASPVEVRVDSKDRIYVTDSFGGKLMVYKPNGETLRTMGGADGMKRPTGLALDEAHNRIYVSDVVSHQIMVYDFEGNFIKRFAERGSDPGYLNFPNNVAVDKEGNVYVTDSGNFRVQIFSPEGEYISSFGKLGDGFGAFARPKGIALDSDSNIYVLDAAFGNFQIFNGDGQLLLFVGTVGKRPGMFWLPAGMYIDDKDRIYVVDSLNKRVQVFQYLKDEGAGETTTPKAALDNEVKADSPGK
ncbi:SMP-30/gluconolactonase/LRE family protein [Pseudomonadota bacterium]